MSSDRAREKIPLSIAAGILWAIPFLSHLSAPIAFVSLVPFLLLLGSGRYRKVLLPSYIVGFTCTALGIGWLWHLAPPLPFVTAAYYGLYSLLFGWGLSVLIRRTRLPLTVLVPPLFIAMEFLRLYVSIFRTTWLHLGNALHGWTDLIQISRWTGHFGVTFVVILVNAAVAEAILSFRREGKLMSARTGGSIGAAVGVLVIALVAGASAATPPNVAGPTIGVAQAGFPLPAFVDSARWDDILREYVLLTRQRGGEGIDLWVWPESAYPGRIERRQVVIEGIARDLSTPLLFGCLASREIDGEERRTNTALFLDSTGKVVGRYDKRILVPFGEEIPIVGRFPSVQKSIADYLHRKVGFRPHIAPGGDADPVSLPWGGREARLGVLICYEAVMPDIARRARRDGADILINLSNEVWFAGGEQDQLLAMAKFRAVENGIYLVRATSTGLSCLISPRGEVVDLLEKDGRSKGVSGILVAEVPLPEGGPTFYARWGDLFCILIFLAASPVIAWGWIRTSRSSRRPPESGHSESS